jgi:hypothetical protein
VIQYPESDPGIRLITALWLRDTEEQRKKRTGDKIPMARTVSAEGANVATGVNGEGKVEIDVIPATEEREKFPDEPISDKVWPSQESR